MEKVTIKQLQDLGAWVNISFPDVGSFEKAEEVLKGIGIDGRLEHLVNTSSDGSTHESLEFKPDYRTRIVATFNFKSKEQSK